MLTCEGKGSGLRVKPAHLRGHLLLTDNRNGRRRRIILLATLVIPSRKRPAEIIILSGLAKHLPPSYSARGHRASHLAAHYHSWQDLPGAPAPPSAARNGMGELPFRPLYDWRGALWRARPRVRRRGFPDQSGLDRSKAERIWPNTQLRHGRLRLQCR